MPYTREEMELLKHMPKGAAAFKDGKKPGNKTSEVQIRPAGPESMADAPSEWDGHDEALDESFPASDPPAH